MTNISSYSHQRRCLASGAVVYELPTRKLPWDWYREVRDEDEEMFSMLLYSSTSGQQSMTLV